MTSLIRHRSTHLALALSVLLTGCSTSPSTEAGEEAGDDRFPPELVSFVPYEGNPLFSGTGTDTWDQHIRERGYIIREDDGYHMWYTGYNGPIEAEKSLGYATSPDGLTWTRYSDKPIFDENWVEDMMVLKHEGRYYMFAEGRGDVAHLLTSTDKINWTEEGDLTILQTNGEPIAPGPYGTPTVYQKDGTWYLFYERDDEGIWVATSDDFKTWTNVQDEPVINKGPEPYDVHGVALNQIVKHGDYYYAYYHGTPTEDWSLWNTDVAISEDLIHWEKYAGNPILEDNKSSGILVHDGRHYRLYTMHDRVDVHFPATDSTKAGDSR